MDPCWWKKDTKGVSVKKYPMSEKHSLGSSLLRGIVAKLYPLLKSKTGYQNPRVKHIRGRLGFALRAFLTLRPNIDKWLNRAGALFPSVVQVQTINRCNAKCPMCPYPYTTGQEQYQEMPDDLWREISEECSREESFKVLVPMSKNEALLDKKLPERIAYFRKCALPHQQVEVVTNGSLLSKDLMRRLTDSGLDMITISLNAMDPGTYQKVMTDLSWEKVTHNIAEIEQLDLSRINVFMRFIEQKDNYQQTLKFKRVWKKKGFNVLTYGINNRSGTVKS